MADLSVKIGELQMKNPVMTASGTFGYGEEYADFVDLERIGGIIVKGTTLHPREGNPYPRMAETPQGMLNAVGLQNKGVHYFVEHIYPRIKNIGTNMIVNVSGSAIEDYAETASIIDGLDKIPAIELNISCPNVKQGGMAFGVTARGAEEVVDSPCGRGGRRGQRVTHQHPAGHGYRCRAASSGALHHHGRHVGSSREAHRPAHGVASVACGKNPRHRTGRHHERAGRRRIPLGGCFGHPNWHGQLHRPLCHGSCGGGD